MPSLSYTFSQEAIGVYLHIPFCSYLCRFCDFEKRLLREKESELFEKALFAELRETLPLLSERKIASLYFGGGTPSLLSLSFFEKFLSTISPFLLSHAEVSLETTPEEVHEQKFRELLSLGVQRISVGIETFSDSLLRRLNRRHNGAEAERALETLFQLDTPNISADLLFALPGQTPLSFAAELQRALNYPLQHLSAYGLTISPSTPLYRDLQRGTFSPCSEEAYEAMYLLACRELTAHGFEHYELSNFSRPGFACRYNLSVWEGGEYLGLGPSAWSCTQSARILRFPHFSDYIASYSMQRAVPPIIEPRDVAQETWLLGLRLRKGIDFAAYEKTFGRDATLNRFLAHLPFWQERGLVQKEGTRVAFTHRGYLVSNEILRTILYG